MTFERTSSNTILGYCLALSIVIALTSTHVQGQPSVMLDRLTVPPSRLPPGCSLTPADSVDLGGGRRRGGLWGGLGLTSNPWRGDDRSIVARIRERVAVWPRVPDGPPPSAADLERFRLERADDIEEAYTAFYADDGVDLIAVHAVRFHEANDPDTPRAGATSSGGIFVLDRTVVTVSGVGQCLEAIATYVGEVTTR